MRFGFYNTDKINKLFLKLLKTLIETGRIVSTQSHLQYTYYIQYIYSNLYRYKLLQSNKDVHADLSSFTAEVMHVHLSVLPFSPTKKT